MTKVTVTDRITMKAWPVIGLRAAAAETRELKKEAGRRNPGHFDIWYDRNDGELALDYLLPGEWSERRTGGDWVKVMTAYGPQTMASIKYHLAIALEAKSRAQRDKEARR